jgi:Uma2 family endonuclease
VLAGNLATDLHVEIRQRNLPSIVPKECVIKISDDTGYEPDVIVLDREALAKEPRWESAWAIEHGTSVKLVIEVVSTNWQDDYDLKMAEYELLGIPEYWIVDYAGFGGLRHLGKPKQPTLTICLLVDGEYETRMFRGEETIVSAIFPGWQLTAAQVLGL